MGERLNPRELALLTDETPVTPMHNATVEVFDPADSGFDHDRLLALIRDRLPFVPRYRQRVQSVPGRLANPSWIDDPHFDLLYHVRRSALPRPGSPDQLRDLVARIVSRPLDRTRPLWEMYFVEGLEGGRVALLSKSHQVLVDGVDTVDLGQVLLDASPQPKDLGSDDWHPRGSDSTIGLVVDALQDTVADPSLVIDTVRSNVAALVRGADDATRQASRVLGAMSGRLAERTTPINGPLSQQRRVVAVDTKLSDHRRIREVHGGTVNDVILAVIAGALRAWLMTRTESLAGLRQIRALVPVSVIDEELEATSLGSQISAHFVDLPIGEASAVVRLHQVSYSFKAHHDTGRGVAADRLAAVSGFAPITFHALGSRLAAYEQRRGFQMTVTNVPGPQFPLYASGARMVSTYPVPPLLPGHAIAIGVTSYDGQVSYGITADRDRVPDADVLGHCVVEALDELLDTVTGSRPRVRRGRRTTTGASTSPTPRKAPRS